MIRLISILFIVFAFKSFGQSQTDYLLKSKKFYQNSEYDSAFVYSKKAFDFYNFQKNDSLKFVAALELFRLSDKKNIQDSTDYFLIANDIVKKKRNHYWDIELYYAKGNYFYFQDEFAEALPLFLKIDSIASKENIKNATTIHAIIKRSEIYRKKFTEETSETAEQLLLEALKMAEDIKSDEMIHLTYSYLADVSGLNERYEEAKRYIDLAFDYYQKEDDIRNLSQMYLLKTAYYLGLDDLENAKKFQADRIKYLRGKDDVLELARALNYDGSFHRRKTKDFNQAIKSLEEAKVLYNTKAKHLLTTDLYDRILYNLAYAYYEVGNHKLAFQYLDESNELHDDILKKTNRKLTSTLEAKYETEKKEKEIAILTAQKAISEQQKKSQTYLFIGVLTLIAISGFLVYLAYRNKLKTANKLKELDTLKSRFFANISHEFRTPLTLIKSPLQLLQDKENDASNKKHLHLIEQHSDRMLSLVNQLLELSKIDSGNLKLLLQKSNLSAFLNALAEPYEFQAKESDLKFRKTIENTSEDYWFDKDVVEKIVTNLLSNALKYITKNHEITFASQIHQNQLKIQVSNHTETLKKEHISKLFERFYQEKESQQGVGIGLALVKELMTLYKGSINTTLEDNILKFSVVLPLDKELLKDVSVISETSDTALIDNTTNENDTELPILLITDDYADVRLILKELFMNDFQILEASDGVEALKLAKHHIPDIIISDVNMPNMDGFELTEKLKNHELTSFIPIILLTTQASETLELKGLQYEADDFIAKPFNHQILKTKVQQLIETRHKLRDRYSKELILRPKDIAINTIDEKFMERLQMVVDEHLSNSDFSMDDFASTVGLSRMQLHRKLKTLLGVSATEFLRNERLKSAALLLKKGGTNISEIAYSVGFNDVSYFSKCFKEMYGVTPTEYGLLP